MTLVVVSNFSWAMETPKTLKITSSKAEMYCDLYLKPGATFVLEKTSLLKELTDQKLSLKQFESQVHEHAKKVVTKFAGVLQFFVTAIGQKNLALTTISHEVYTPKDLFFIQPKETKNSNFCIVDGAGYVQVYVPVNLKEIQTFNELQVELHDDHTHDNVIDLQKALVAVFGSPGSVHIGQVCREVDALIEYNKQIVVSEHTNWDALVEYINSFGK